ncbi:uncharacterized protein LOC142357963 [Convolutriloba macropyga]|uniref:uncharacterized protein LOC142357963 n=1 Tax=Convolutriloba macropyga TaxID=536237 RepID=UPI003F520A64
MGKGQSRPANYVHGYQLTYNVKAVSEYEINDGSYGFSVSNVNGVKYEILAVYVKTTHDICHFGFLLSDNQFYAKDRGRSFNYCILHRLVDNVVLLVSDYRDDIIRSFMRSLEYNGDKKRK